MQERESTKEDVVACLVRLRDVLSRLPMPSAGVSEVVDGQRLTFQVQSVAEAPFGSGGMTPYVERDAPEPRLRVVK